MRERGLFEYLNSQPTVEEAQERAIERLRRGSAGGQLGPSRRQLLTAGLAGSAWRMLGLGVPMARFAPLGLFPVASFAAEEGTAVAAVAGGAPAAIEIPGKPGLRLLNDRPLNAETPAHLLDDLVTPTKALFVRNNGVAPVGIDPATWTLKVHGEACEQPRTFTLAQLRENFRSTKLALQLECGGNGRSEFRPRAGGNQWTTGAIGCPQWTGIRLADVLRACGIGRKAQYVAYVSADTHLSGDPAKQPISRGVPIAKALEKESLLAFELNGRYIADHHGAPLRMVCGGWPGSVSGKWVTEILIRDREHDGAKMGGKSYRVPRQPVEPGAKVADADMRIIESMPVKSLITFPESGTRAIRDTDFVVRGHAWAGDKRVKSVELSTNFGASWERTELAAPANRLAWQRFVGAVKFTQPGYYEIWARARDADDQMQPMLVPGWNPKGYLNNACHRIAVQVL